MRKVLFLCFLVGNFIHAQEQNALKKNTFSVDFGSLRNRYVYPKTDIIFTCSLIKSSAFRVSARLRSYGTLYFFSKSAYDVTPLVEYYFSKTEKPIYFSTGVGLDARIRLINDSRSTATSSVEPLLSLALHGNYKKISYSLPLWTRWYSNGMAYTLLPQINWNLSEKNALFVRYEMNFLRISKNVSNEWNQDVFVGLKRSLN
jgi:hypothetical protein